MSEKAKLTKEQAAAVEFLRTRYACDINKLLMMHASTDTPWTGGDLKVLNGMSMETFARALLVGYGIKLEPLTVTVSIPVEKIEELRKEAKERSAENWAAGIRWTLRILGISEEVLGE